MTGEAPMSVRLLVFDCDGTLVDSQRAIVGAMHAAFTSCSLPEPAAERVRGVIGLSLDHAIATLHPAAEPEQVTQLNRLYCEAFAAHRAAGLHHDPLYPGALDALEVLGQDGWLLGVATGSPCAVCSRRWNATPCATASSRCRPRTSAGASRTGHGEVRDGRRARSRTARW